MTQEGYLCACFHTGYLIVGYIRDYGLSSSITDGTYDLLIPLQIKECIWVAVAVNSKAD